MSDLLNSITLLADRLAADLGESWHRHKTVLEAFEAGVAAFLTQYRSKAADKAGANARVAGELYDEPGAVGRTLARRIWTEKREGKLPVDVEIAPWREPKPAKATGDCS
jgi:hypothetical protein